MLPQYFRSWDKENKKFYYYYLNETDQGYLINQEVMVDDLPTDQFTGEYDLNKKEIFDKDIVELLGYHDGKYYSDGIFKIEYKEGCFGISYGKVNLDSSELFLAARTYLYNKNQKYVFKIIGNIYETPELLSKLNV